MLAYSSNVGTIEIADKLGPDRLIDYQKRFGLGQPDRRGDARRGAGRLLPADQWSGSSYGSVPIGHSVDATPLQMAAAYATIANDGTYVQPHLIKEVIGPDGKRTPAAAPVTRSVLSPQNAAALRTMLEAVTTVDGRHRPGRRGPRLPGRRQDRHRPAASRRQAAARRGGLVHRDGPGREPRAT